MVLSSGQGSLFIAPRADLILACSSSEAGFQTDLVLLVSSLALRLFALLCAVAGELESVLPEKA